MHQQRRHSSSFMPPGQGQHHWQYGSHLNAITAGNSYNTNGTGAQPDIQYFLSYPSHPIFTSAEWNPRIWLREFRNSQGNDVRQRWLRVIAQINTIGVVRDKYYVTETGKQVLLRDMRPQTSIYDSRTVLRVNSTKSVVQPIYPQTTVRVMNADCLHVYEELAAQGYQPLLLNMANAQTPGGGYRRGAKAQEENIFRRSDYFLSLDNALDTERRCEFFWCSDQGEQQRVTPYTLYPMSEFGALYTRGITVFRDSEDKGYAFLNDPIYNVSAIAMAAYQNPPLKQGNHLSPEYAANTRKKIENIFAIAQHHNHDCLVLSAFGCGAFKNPPGDIAALFKTVILQYAGFFHSIVFAITGKQNNPQGNFASFHNLLHNYNVTPPNVWKAGMSLGSHRIWEIHSNRPMILSDFAIGQNPCKYGRICKKTTDQDHCRRFSHPSVCPHETPHCITDTIHYQAFVHR